MRERLLELLDDDIEDDDVHDSIVHYSQAQHHWLNSDKLLPYQ